MQRSTATFLMTDVEGSTALWESDAEGMAAVIAKLDQLVANAVASHDGELVKSRGEGDSHFAVFSNAAGAVTCACSLMLALDEALPNLRVRVAIHTGDAEVRAADYYGPVVNRCARIRAIGHGGQILISQAASQLVRDFLPSGVGLIDLGEHRLKDLMRPERIFQVKHPNLLAQFEPLRSLRVDRTNLPVQLTSFVGRVNEMVLLHSELARHRLVTLLGPGGSGKTRLAAHAAAELVDAYEDGVWFVPLAPLSDPDSVEGAVSGTLRAAFDSAGSDWKEGARERSFLLVLDNCEHLEDGPSQVIRKLIDACPKARVLATSRRPLNLSAEALHRVPCLALPSMSDLPNPDALGDVESVRLLLDRAATKAPGFELKEANVAGISELCAALDGVPLAIELAAPKLNTLSPERIVQRMRSGQDMLRSSDHDVDPRHKTLTATIEWSLSLLTAELQDFLALASLFPAGFSFDAVEALSPGIGLELVTELINHSLVQVEHRADGEPRYRILETIRQHIQRRADPALLQDGKRRLFDWALALAREAKPALAGQQQEIWMRRLQEEYENLRVGLEWASDAGAEELLGLASNLDRFWHRQGMLQEGRTWLEAALSDLAEVGSLEAATAARSAGVFANLMGDTRAAMSHLERAVLGFRRIGDEREAAAALVNRALVQIAEECRDDARVSLSEALASYRLLKDTAREAMVLQNLGTLELDLQRYDAAEPLLRQALDRLRELNDAWGTAMALGNLGALYVETGRTNEAVDVLRQSLLRWGELGDWVSASLVLKHMATLAVYAEHFEFGAHLLMACDSLRRRAAYKAPTMDQQETALLRDTVFARLPESAIHSIKRQTEAANPEELLAYAVEGIGLVTSSDLSD